MDKDPKLSNSEEINAAGPEDKSRRRLLKAGIVAVPVMITIKSASAQATGITPATWPHLPPPPDQGQVYGSISCIQRIEMPNHKNDALHRICDHKGISYKSSNSGNPWQSKNWNQPKNGPDCGDLRSYFKDNDFGTHHTFFDPSKEHHCTYMEMMVSHTCISSIVSSGQHYHGGKKWSNNQQKFI